MLHIAGCLAMAISTLRIAFISLVVSHQHLMTLVQNTAGFSLAQTPVGRGNYGIKLKV